MDRKWRALIIVCVAIFMLLLDITVVNVALPDIQKELHASFTDLQWVVDAYALTLASVVLVAGTLGDMLGRKRVFLSGVALFTLASALCGAATSPLFLNLARGLQGIGGAIMFAVSLAILSQEFHGKERGTAFGIWGSTIGAAVAIGPLVGGALTTWLGWRWIFFVNLPIGVLCIVGGLRVLHESRNETHGGLDIFGFVTLTGGLFSLVLALLRGNDWGWSSGRVVTLYVLAVVLLVGFYFIERGQREPMLDFSLFRVPTFTGAQIVAFAISSAMFAQFLYLTLYLQNVLGLSPIQAGLRFLPLSLVSFFVAPVSGGLSARLPVRYLLGGGLALVGLALVLMHGVTPSSDWTTLLPGFIVGGIGIGMVNPPLASTAVSVVAAAAGRDGVGGQQHLPPGRDRDGHRRSRRDLPGHDQVALARCRLGAGRRLGRRSAGRRHRARRIHRRPERDPPRRGDRRIRGRSARTGARPQPRLRRQRTGSLRALSFARRMQWRAGSAA